MQSVSHSVSCSVSLIASASDLLRVVSDISAFSIIIWFAHSTVKNSQPRTTSLMRTIVADATVYFITVMLLQVVALLFLSFVTVRRPPPLTLILLTRPLSGYDRTIPNGVRTLFT